MSALTQLSDHALLATLVGRETARRILDRAAGSLLNVVQDARKQYVVPGRTALPPSPLQAAIEFARRAALEEAKASNYLTSPAQVREYLRLELRGLEHEEFHVVLLDAGHGVIGFERMFRGSLTQTSVYPREVVKLALERNAAAVIFAHNHPSGAADPSEADKMLTRTLKDALAYLDVRVLDHFIVAGATVTSFAERGIL